VHAADHRFAGSHRGKHGYTPPQLPTVTAAISNAKLDAPMAAIGHTHESMAHHRRYETPVPAIHKLTEYIELCDNRQRRCWKSGYIALNFSPAKMSIIGRPLATPRNTIHGPSWDIDANYRNLPGQKVRPHPRRGGAASGHPVQFVCGLSLRFCTMDARFDRFDRNITTETSIQWHFFPA
jgi:hypothetical protein